MKKTYRKPRVKIDYELDISKLNEVDGRLVTIKADNSIMLREIAGEYLLIPVGESATRIHGMISLSESGYLLWKRIQTEATEEDLIDLILAEYVIDRETATKDVRAFVQKMRKAGILEEGDSSEE